MRASQTHELMNKSEVSPSRVLAPWSEDSCCCCSSSSCCCCFFFKIPFSFS
jgi:hypothetical protein